MPLVSKIFIYVNAKMFMNGKRVQQNNSTWKNLYVIVLNITYSFSDPTEVYPFFKRLCTEICLSIFLDLDFESSASVAEDIVQLTTTHWHGKYCYHTYSGPLDNWACRLIGPISQDM